MTRINIFKEKISIDLPTLIDSRFLICANSGGGKALDISTPIPTPFGWKTMEDIKKGDTLFDEKGNTCKVVNAFDIQCDRPCFEIIFNDNSKIVADKDHLWITSTQASRHADRYSSGTGKIQSNIRKCFTSVKTTEEILSTICISAGQGKSINNHHIKNTEPIKIEEKKLLIDPYLLGVWLGDGTSSCGRITASKNDIKTFKKIIKQRGYDVIPRRGKANSKILVIKGLTTKLRESKLILGKRNNKMVRGGLIYNKHVPTEYLFSSISQRLDLLGGLMDTDGTIRNYNNNCEFDNTNKSLIDAVYQLVCSLGWKATIHQKRAYLYGRDCGIVYRVSFRPTEQIFKLKRKAMRLNLSVGQTSRHLKRVIVAINPVSSRPVRCISVDSKSNMFLCGYQMIPTHNSYAVRKFLEETHGKVMAIVLDTEGEFKTLREKFDFLLIGEKGDVPLSDKAVRLLPKKLLELNVSTIIDISELKKNERIQYVKKFLEALMECPRDLWKPCLIILDETHNLAGQMEKQDSTFSVIDLATRGRKRGFCLHPNVKIITKNGLKRIKDVKQGEYVLTHKGRFRRVIATSVRDYSGEIISINSYGSYEPTITTPNHLYLTHIVKNNGYGSKVLNSHIWIEAEKIIQNKNKKLSQRLFSPSLIDEEDINELFFHYKKRKKERKTKIKKKGEGYKDISLPLNKELMKVIGYFLAEGSYIKRKYQIEKNLCGIQFAFGKNKKEERYAIEVRDCLLSLGYNPKLRKLKNGQFYVRLRVREIAEVFKNYLGEYSYGKRIHPDILMLPKEKLQYLFEAYINGDGHRRKNFIGSATVSEELACGLFLIGQKLGYSTSIQHIKNSGKKGIINGRKINLRDIFGMTFTNVSSRSLNKRVEKYFAKAIKSKNSRWYEGKVYNLQVEEDESYCSIGHIIHNCLVACTQRISKLHKDVVAELNNYMVGRTGLDIDQKRAGEILGFTNKKDILSLRDLEAGEFNVFGTAISREVIKVKVEEVQTTHPKVGMDLKSKIVPPTEKIKQMLSKLSELPKEVEEEMKTLEDYKNKVIKLQVELRKAEFEAKRKEPAQIDESTIQKLLQKEISKIETKYKSYIKPIEENLNKLKLNLGRVIKDATLLMESRAFSIVSDIPIRPIIPNIKQEIIKTIPQRKEIKMPEVISGIDSEYNLNLCEKKIYSLLAQYSERSFTKPQIGVFTGYSHNSGGFNNSLSHLRTMDLVEGSGDNLKAKKIVETLVQEFDYSKEAIIPKLNKCEREIYNVLLENPYADYSKEQLAEMTETHYSANSGGFNNSISRLNTLGIIQRNSGVIKLNPELLEI